MSDLLQLPDLAARANSAHLAASGAAISALEHARTAGEALNAAKKLLPHGEWLPWLANHFEGGRSTAANYMRIAANWDSLNVQHVPHLTVRAALGAIAESNPVRAVVDREDAARERVNAALERSVQNLKAELEQTGGWLDDGTGVMVHVPSLPEAEQERVLGNAVMEETYERRQRQGMHIQEHYENHDASGRVIDKRKAFYSFVARKPCLRCGVFGVEVAHVRVILSPKTGLLLPRRKGLAEWGVIPLCAECHRLGADSIHSVGEQVFSDNLGRGASYLVQAAATLIVEFFVGQREGSGS